jgi:dTDP-4-dehydrorhamnose reductase
MGAWMDDLERGREIRCARDQIFSPIAVEDVVAGLMALVESRCNGLFHLCSTAPLSRWELLNLLMAEIRRYRVIKAHVTPCSIRDFEFAEPRPLDTSMSAVKVHTALGCRFKNMREICREAADRRYGRSGLSVPATS